MRSGLTQFITPLRVIAVGYQSVADKLNRFSKTQQPHLWSEAQSLYAKLHDKAAQINDIIAAALEKEIAGNRSHPLMKFLIEGIPFAPGARFTRWLDALDEPPQELDWLSETIFEFQKTSAALGKFAEKLKDSSLEKIVPTQLTSLALSQHAPLAKQLAKGWAEVARLLAYDKWNEARKTYLRYLPILSVLQKKFAEAAREAGDPYGKVFPLNLLPELLIEIEIPRKFDMLFENSQPTADEIKMLYQKFTTASQAGQKLAEVLKSEPAFRAFAKGYKQGLVDGKSIGKIKQIIKLLSPWSSQTLEKARKIAQTLFANSLTQELAQTVVENVDAVLAYYDYEDYSVMKYGRYQKNHLDDLFAYCKKFLNSAVVA